PDSGIKDKPKDKEIPKPKDKETPKPKDKKPDDKGTATGWIKLFNGKDLTGWKPFLGKKDADPKETFSVKDGIIICTGQPFTYLLTDKEYGDYTRKVQWRWQDK